MAAPVLPLQHLRDAPGPAPLTPDQAHWRTFKSQASLPSPHNNAITSITTGATDNFAVTAGGRVQILSTKSRKVIKTISRFGVDDVARSGVLRRDGRVLLAGGDSGVVQAFDTSSRAILKQWGRNVNAQKRQAVHCVRWDPSVLTQFLTCGDDRVVTVWDLTEDEHKWQGIGHEDYVRTACWLPGQQGIAVTGSYDQTVRVWDTRAEGGRSNGSVMVFKHSAPVEHVLALDSSTVAVAAGNEVSILNIAAAKVEHIIRSHQKTVTCLATAENGSRILTAGLDGHVKVHVRNTWQVVAGFKYQSPILSINVVRAATGEDRHLVVGQQNGLLSIRTRIAGQEKVRQREKDARMQALLEGTADEYERKQKKKDLRQGIRARDRGKDFRGEGADIIISGQEKRKDKKLNPWQMALRRGRYAEALDLVLAPGSSPAQGKAQHNFGAQAGISVDHENVLTLLTALRHRSALRASLSSRHASQLLPVMRWMLKNLPEPRRFGLIYETLLVVLDLYSAKLAEWAEGVEEEKEFRSLVERIGKRVRKSIELAEQCHSVQGMLGLLAAG
ncbi:WD40 repeat-like protein [Polychaeton citri CBS 116435]|uniref:WD40 repeat-like protein n=1 Tax=Polychaeton citri CBS 116435 TaxID=1314669 RepID=A0A9P4QJS3_9PEZI|nr:WD40 repeat-like protein [Polychaeton citri CBS 116435]